jgi:hypothetical protein
MKQLGWQNFNRVPNFLKHADNDPDAALFDHVADETMPLMGFATTLHHRILGWMTPEMRGFDAWMHVMHPDVFEIPPDPDPAFDEAFRESVKRLNGGPRGERLAMGDVLIKFYREHPEVGGFGARRDPASY